MTCLLLVEEDSTWEVFQQIESLHKITRKVKEEFIVVLLIRHKSTHLTSTTWRIYSANLFFYFVLKMFLNTCELLLQTLSFCFTPMQKITLTSKWTLFCWECPGLERARVETQSLERDSLSQKPVTCRSPQNVRQQKLR